MLILMDADCSGGHIEVKLGEPLNQRNRRSRLRLRSAAKIYPEIVNPSLDEDTEPSCSAIEALELLVLYVDGVILGEHHVLGAVGVDAEGGKHVLGLAEGASENQVVARGLLEDLVRRGVKPDRLPARLDTVAVPHRNMADVLHLRDHGGSCARLQDLGVRYDPWTMSFF